MGDLSRHFDRDEFACKDDCGFDTVDYALLCILERVREHFNKPVHITSGCRCMAHNERCGGSSRSQHLQGRAADIIVQDTDPDDVADYLESIMTHGGIGRSNVFTHIDTRTNDYVAGWSY